MSETHKVIFYPVGNGDTSQIVLDNGRRVLFDFCHRDKAEDDDTPEIDLKKRLRIELKDAKRDNFDVVAFTHADQAGERIRSDCVHGRLPQRASNMVWTRLRSSSGSKGLRR